SAAPHDVTLSARVTSGGAGVTGGTVIFSVVDGNNNFIGSNSSSSPDGDSVFSAPVTLPAGQSLGLYTIRAFYQHTAAYLDSFDNSQTLTIVPAATTTVAADASSTFATAAQQVTLSASVTSAGAGVGEGTVTFAVLRGATQVGNSVTSGT